MLAKGRPATRRHHHTKEEALVTWSYICEKLLDIELMKEEQDEPINLSIY